MLTKFRLLYLPSVGFAMLLSLLCWELSKMNFKYPIIFIIGLGATLLPVNLIHQDAFNPTSAYVLHHDKAVYTHWYNKIDKEQRMLLEKKLKKYGLLNETRDLRQREEEKIDRLNTKNIKVVPNKNKLYEPGWLIKIFQRMLPQYI